MSFLNPWLWLGALAVVAPLWLHLRRKREKNLVAFSAVRFLDDQPHPRRSPLQLRDWLLFAVRVLALLLLVAAFAWPYLRRFNTVPVKESRVYVLDNTLSRQANHGFEQDRARVSTEIRRAGSEVQVAVVELGATPRVVASFGDTRETAEQRVSELQPSFQRGSYLAAFRQANSLLENSLGQQKRIVFLGDEQENQWSENLHIPPFLRNVEVDLTKPQAKTLPNLSLSEPRTQRVFLGDKSQVNFSVKLAHAGPAKTARVVVRANGQVIINRTVELEKAPETIQLQAQWEADPRTWLRGEASVEGTPDALAGDDRVYFSLAPVMEGSVALLAQSPYLKLALSPEIMRGQWLTRGLDPAKLEAELAAKNDADVLCIESSYLQGAAARKLLRHYLDSGRGVLLLVNQVTPVIDGYLRELGFETGGTVTAPAGQPEQFEFIFSNHPIFYPFRSPDYGNLMDINVTRFVRLKATQAMPLVFGGKGTGLFFQSSKFPGKLFVAAFGLDRAQTSWPIHQTFIPFLDLTLQAARAQDPAPTTFEPAEAVVLSLPAAAKTREVVLRQEQREVARAAVTQGRARVRMPDNPGLYSLTYDDSDRVEKVLSINPSPKESALVFAESQDLAQEWRVKGPARSVQMAGPAIPEQMRVTAILQQRLWWWMVLGALLTLMLEMVLVELRKERA